jgi:hypothetical protein
MVIQSSPAASDVPLDKHSRAAYRPPELLRPLHVLDFWELIGNQALAGEVLQLHQSTVSRIVTAINQQFQPQRRAAGLLEPNPLRYLRLAARAHRMGEGVLRLASDPLHQALLDGLPLLQPVPPRFRPIAVWVELIQQGVIDGAIVPAPMPAAPGAWPPWAGVRLVELGALELQLALARGGRRTVLVPDAGLAPLLHHHLLQQQWPLLPLGPGWRDSQDWQQMAQRRGLALPVAPALLHQRWLHQTQRTQEPLSPPLLSPLLLLMAEEAAVGHTVQEGEGHLCRRLQRV